VVSSSGRSAGRALALALACAACSGPRIEYSRSDAADRTSERLPLAVGNSWTFVVTDDAGDAPLEKTQTVLGRGSVGLGPSAHVEAFRLTTRKTGDPEWARTESHQGVVVDPLSGGLRVVRYRETSFDPESGAVDVDEYWDEYRLRVDDFHEAATGTWTEEYLESTLEAGEEPELDVPRTETWNVATDHEEVTVPAGTFRAVVVVRQAKDPSDAKTYWFVDGVGKVKETGGKTEELVDCIVGGARCAELPARLR
jgi:hypothetical protein